MSAIIQLINALRELKIEPICRDGHLKLRGPSVRLTPDLLDQVRVHKAELIALLSDPANLASTIARHCEDTGDDVTAYLNGHPELAALIVRLGDSASCMPAPSIVATCQSYGLLLRIDQLTGDLMVSRIGGTADESSQPWQSLVCALQAHLEAISHLVQSGWTLRSEFPKQVSA